MHKKIWTLIVIATAFGCSKDDSVDSFNDGFDRKVMLINWADNLIIPGYEDYVSSLQSLTHATHTFIEEPDQEALTEIRETWLEAYLIWQSVAFYDVGKAEELTLVNYTNIYPTNTEDLVKTIASGSYDLSSVNKQDEQGFPAIEYMIYGIGDTDEEILNTYLAGDTSESYKNYLKDLVEKLQSMADVVLEDWKNSYREEFINNDGSESTSSVNKLVNDYIFYYEKHLRAGKIGIPAGVFSGSSFPEKVEGVYSAKSKVLFKAGIEAIENFFNGKHYNSDLEGASLKSYLAFVNGISEGEDLAEAINAQFGAVENKADRLSDNFRMQVESNNNLMLETYDELQKNVIYFKVDMLQALNIRVDYVDADGD